MARYSRGKRKRFDTGVLVSEEKIVAHQTPPRTNEMEMGIDYHIELRGN
jgi:hypothetical protein